MATEKCSKMRSHKCPISRASLHTDGLEFKGVRVTNSWTIRKTPVKQRRGEGETDGAPTRTPARTKQRQQDDDNARDDDDATTTRLRQKLGRKACVASAPGPDMPKLRVSAAIGTFEWNPNHDWTPLRRNDWGHNVRVTWCLVDGIAQGLASFTRG